MNDSIHNMHKANFDLCYKNTTATGRFIFSFEIHRLYTFPVRALAHPFNQIYGASSDISKSLMKPV